MSRYVVNCNWMEVPHLPKEEQKAIEAALPPHALEAAKLGLPSVGSGKIYPVSEEIYIKRPFKIPDHWPRVAGLDVGFHNTAAVFGAYDAESDTWYLYGEYLGKDCEPAVNSQSLRMRNKGWIPFVIDPGSLGAGQETGTALFDIYEKNGLNLTKANNSVQVGLLECYQRMSEGRLIVFETLVKTIEEIRVYHTNKMGKVVKKNDHLCDAFRYLVMTGQDVMMTEPMYDEEVEIEAMSYRSSEGRNSTTGY